MNRTEVVLSIVLGVVTLAQTVFQWWARRSGREASHDAIASKVLEKLNGRK